LYEGAKESELSADNVDEDAKRCVILAIKVPTVINFEEVLDLDAIKHLQGVSKCI
jgi:hypothetical protein